MIGEIIEVFDSANLQSRLERGYTILKDSFFKFSSLLIFL